MVVLAGFFLFFNPFLIINAAELNLKWNQQLESPVHLPPVLTVDQVIATTSDGVIHAYSRKSGELNWRTDQSTRFWDRSLIVTGNGIVVGSSGGFLQAISISDGSVMWITELGTDVQTRPLLVDDTLFVSTTHVGPELENDPHGKAVFFGVDINTGRIKSQRTTENYALQRPAYYDQVIYLAGSYYDPAIEVDEGGPMRVSAIKRDGSSKLWEHKGTEGFVKAIYADDKSVVYVGYQDFVVALNRENGQFRWRRDSGNWTPSLLGSNGVIYFGSATTQVFAISSANGESLWSFNIGGGTFNYLLGEPVLQNGVLYFLTQKGDIYAIDAITGESIRAESTGIDARAGLSVDEKSIVMGGINGSLHLYNF